MGFREVFAVVFLVGCASAQNLRVCVQVTERTLCNNLDREGQAICETVESRVDCALKLNNGAADLGVFTEEEVLLLGQMYPAGHRVVATIRDVARTEPFAFEAVAVVSAFHTNGLAGLRNSRYCHPGFDQADLRWSPRVLKTFEYAVANSDRCPNAQTDHRTADELEVETLNEFFGAACRPGPWSVNSTVDANLKTRFPNLCASCGPSNATCAGYTFNMGASVAGINNNNRHIQALECLRSNATNAVAYVAWQHVREFFTIRNPEAGTSFAVLCPDGSIRPLTTEILSNGTSPCAFVRQPWSTVIANPANSGNVLTSLRTWYPNGLNPGAGSWQGVLFNGIIGGSNAQLFFEDGLPAPANYTSGIRMIPAIDATATCIRAQRWCTLSPQEQMKCNWVRQAAFALGVQPSISCFQRANTFDCLRDIRDNQADFIASSSNYGYLARQHYNLSPVKLVQNSRSATNAFSRVAAFVKETSAQGNITRFENLRGRRACFPEYGGIAYVAFVRAAQERGVITSSECDYARAVGEFFGSACAPGAVDASHALGESSFNATALCTVCRPAITVVGNYSDFTCSWDHSNLFFGNNGTLRCLADPENDVAFLQVQNIQTHLNQLGLQANQFRALCRNNTLAVSTGVNVDDNCLLARVVDAEVVTRRNDPFTNALNVLLETLDAQFGYLAETGVQLINLEIFSPFDGVSDLLFKDTAIGLTEPSNTNTDEAARNYFELFQHLESCTGAAAPGPGAPGTPGHAARHLLSVVTLISMTLLARFVVY